MIVNSANLADIRAGFLAAYQGAFDSVEVNRGRIASEMPSTAGENLYSWLGELSDMEEWISDRTVDALSSHDYRIKNRDWQKTVGVDRNTIEDDTYGQFTPKMDILGRTAARHPERLVFGALLDGWSTDCYDGQPFFDADHPVIGEDGEKVSVANTDGGTDAPWFLLCTSEVVKPIIFQNRKKAQFVSKDQPDSEGAFWQKKFFYGADARYAVGYGFWQMAWGSKQPLTAANYEKARAALGGMKGDHGVPMGLKPNLLVCGASNEGAARKLLNNEMIDGSDNEWRGTAELLVSGYLS